MVTSAPHDLPDSVYDLLRGLAAQLMAREASGHTLQPTAVVHEAYLRLAQQQSAASATPDQLISIAALMIRRVLIDHHRMRSAAKRGSGERAIFVDHATPDHDSEHILAVEEALIKLERLDPEKARIVTMRFYAGLSIEQIADITGQSARTIARQWSFARAWLSRELADAEH